MILALAAEASSGTVTRRNRSFPAPRPGFFSPLGHAERDGLCSAWARRSAAMSPRRASDRAELPPCGEGGGEEVTAQIPPSRPGRPRNLPSSILDRLHFLATPPPPWEALCDLPAGREFSSALQQVVGQGCFAPTYLPPKPPSLQFFPHLKRATILQTYPHGVLEPNLNHTKRIPANTSLGSGAVLHILDKVVV